MMTAWILPVACLASAPAGQAIGVGEAVQQIALDLDRGRPSTSRLTIRGHRPARPAGVTSDLRRFVAEGCRHSSRRSPGSSRSSAAA
jgi:hypothetical protein